MAINYDFIPQGNIGTEVGNARLLDFSKRDFQVERSLTDQRDFSRVFRTTKTDSRSFSTQTSSVFNPIDNRSLTLVLSSPGANATTKKDIEAETSPGLENAPSTALELTDAIRKSASALTEQAQSLSNGLNVGRALLFGGLAVGGYFILRATPVGRMIFGDNEEKNGKQKKQ